MTMYKITQFLFVLALAGIQSESGRSIVQAFTSSHGRTFRTTTATTTTSTTTTRLQSTSPSSSSSSLLPQDIFILSYDGVVADTNEWRSNLAIDVALQTWPQLKLNEHTSIMIEQDRSWLVNKISALLSVTLSSGNDGMMGCDAVLLARLLMEEQLLDEGRSVGCKGKYGSKFHPTTTTTTEGDDSHHGVEYSQRDLKSRQGSRPLTVGEIAANWNDGACLKDTVRIKYNVDRKDPIPIIQENIQHCLENIDTRALPQIRPSISDALLDCDSPVYILVGHRSHVSTAAASMSHLSIPIHSMDSDEEYSLNDDHDGEAGVTIVPPPRHRDGGGHETVLESIFMSVKEGSSVHVIHSDVSILRKAKTLFGDHRPLSVGAFGASARDGVELKLSLPTMGSGPQQQNDAEMDPWLNIINEFDLVENLSSRIISN